MTFDTSEKLTKKTQNNKTVKIQEIVTKKQKSTKFRKKLKKLKFQQVLSKIKNMEFQENLKLLKKLKI